MRLFVGEPVWTPYNRDVVPEDHPSRVKYIEHFVKPVTTKENGDAKRQKIEEERKTDGSITA